MKNTASGTEWSVYWSQNKLHSFVISGNENQASPVDDLWQSFAKNLDLNAKLLDLATGNGAVPAAIIRVRPDILIQAVDKADIAPLTYLTNTRELEPVVFYPNTDIASLPFPEREFDVLTSQFGIEYSNLFEITESVIKLLKANGKYQFLIHHKQSDAIGAARKKVIEAENLLASEGPLEVLASYLQGGCELSKLDQKINSYLNMDFPRSSQISGQILSAIPFLVDSFRQNSEQANDLFLTMLERFRAEHKRLSQMQQSALDSQQVKQYCSLLERLAKAAPSLTEHRIIIDDVEHLTGWLVSGRNV